MTVIAKRIKVNTKGNTDIIDITQKVDQKLSESRLKNGVVTLFVPGSTGGLTTCEYESGLVKDLRVLFERLAPQRIEYAHNLRWHDGNGFSHVRSSLLGASLSVPFVDGDLQLGTWQQIIFVDFDNRARTRELVLQFIGV